MAETIAVKNVVVASTDYIGGPSFKTRLMPAGMKRDRLSRGLVRLTDQHISPSAKPKVHAVVKDIRTSGDLYVGDWDIPIVASNASYIEDREVGLVGKSFSIGVEVFEAREVGVADDGAYLVDILAWEAIEVIDTAVPGDIRAVARSAEGGEGEVYSVGNLVLTSGNQAVLDVLQRNFGRTEGGKAMTTQNGITDNGDRAAMVKFAQRSGLSEDLAEQEVTEAIERGESRGAYAERKGLEIARTVNVMPQRFGDIQRDGFQGFDLGRYVDAVMGRERRDAGHEIEFAKLAREHYDSWEGQAVPFSVAMPRAEQRVLYSDVSGAIDLMVDTEDAAPFFAEMEPWLAWVTMVSMGVGGGAFQLPVDGGTDPTAETPVEGAAITESEPDISGAPMNALTIASYHTLGSGAYATGGPALSMFLRDIFESFVRTKLAAGILNGSGASGQISGIWAKLLAARTHEYGATLTDLDYEDITSVYALVRNAAAHGRMEGWVLNPTLEAALMTKQPFTNASRGIAMRERGDMQGVGDILGAGMYSSSKSMTVASVVNPGIYGLWSRCVVPIWGTAFELIEQAQAKNNFREYSVRLYANMQVANLGAFAKIRQT